ncbi:tyrosine-type recombinase/integrase [Denitrificimonas caeni]|uniref:Tyrosine-type recombinase/integrase n=1 Tax=Denitrificimonas caeni TaxID=521720 RepID=A0AAE9VR63_9GAMM|nr:site-specific integrase [Denitrificimonas caeni]WBE26239.1 tyrosine-type recombinase/integrase [Denitrificimonas caeni]
MKDLRLVFSTGRASSAETATKVIEDHLKERRKDPEQFTGIRTVFTCDITGGLELRIGVRTVWSLSYNIKRGSKWSKRRYVMGFYPALSVAAARTQANALKGDIAQGIDPAQAKKEIAEQRQKAIDEACTVTELFNQWICSPVMTSRKLGTDEPARMMKKDVLPVIGKLDVKSVTPRHLASINNRVAERGNRAANILLALLRQMMGYALDQGIIEALPRFPSKLEENAPCDRVLSVPELVELFDKLPSAKLINTTELAIKIQLATACRIGELLRAKWSDVCLDAGEWVIPAENSKNGDPIKIFLSQYAQGLFKQLKDISADADYIVSSVTGAGAIDQKAVTKQVRDRQRGVQIAGRTKLFNTLILSCGTWTPHDLRRTAASSMQSLQINPYIIERCLNHKPDKITATYIPQDPELEMYEAWEAWGQVLAVADSAKGAELAALYTANAKQPIVRRKRLAELMRQLKGNVVQLHKMA